MVSRVVGIGLALVLPFVNATDVETGAGDVGVVESDSHAQYPGYPTEFGSLLIQFDAACVNGQPVTDALYHEIVYVHEHLEPEFNAAFCGELQQRVDNLPQTSCIDTNALRQWLSEVCPPSDEPQLEDNGHLIVPDLHDALKEELRQADLKQGESAGDNVPMEVYGVLNALNDPNAEFKDQHFDAMVEDWNQIPVTVQCQLPGFLQLYRDYYATLGDEMSERTVDWLDTVCALLRHTNTEAQDTVAIPPLDLKTAELVGAAVSGAPHLKRESIVSEQQPGADVTAVKKHDTDAVHWPEIGEEVAEKQEESADEDFTFSDDEEVVTQQSAEVFGALQNGDVIDDVQVTNSNAQPSVDAQPTIDGNVVSDNDSAELIPTDELPFAGTRDSSDESTLGSPDVVSDSVDSPLLVAAAKDSTNAGKGNAQHQVLDATANEPPTLNIGNKVDGDDEVDGNDEATVVTNNAVVDSSGNGNPDVVSQNVGNDDNQATAKQNNDQTVGDQNAGDQQPVGDKNADDKKDSNGATALGSLKAMVALLFTVLVITV